MGDIALTIPRQIGLFDRVAALYVLDRGPYVGLPGVEAWALPHRDARAYAGPWPVVAHPPCERWGRYWDGGPSKCARRTLGDDDGCFEAALESVREWGGILEHPEASHAFRAYGLGKPPRAGGWVASADGVGHVCCVEQGHYGHRARKLTWLYAVGTELPGLVWGPSEALLTRGEVYASEAERRRAVKTGAVQRMSRRERAATPAAFREVLLGIARSAVWRRRETA